MYYTEHRLRNNPFNPSSVSRCDTINVMERFIPRPQQRRHSLLRRLWTISGVAMVLLVIANGIMMVLYQGRALPHSYLGRLAAGGQSFASLTATSPDMILPATFTLAKGTGRTATLAPSTIGLSIDVPASIGGAPKLRRWLPILSLFLRENIPLHAKIDAATFSRTVPGLDKTFSQAALPQHIIFSGSSFRVTNASEGFKLDTNALPTAIIQAASTGRTVIPVPTTTLAAPVSNTDLAPQLQSLQKQLTTKLGFTYKQQRIEPSVKDIGSWYVASGIGMEPSVERIAAYLQDRTTRQFAIILANPNDLAVATAYALSKDLPRNLAIVPQASSTVVRTYCTAVRDVSDSVLDDLIGKLAVTYNDTRGWNNNGQIAFEHVNNGCQYTVWMSAASQMTGFGAICDDYYNCQIGSNVILNYDRWMSATDPWNATHGSLEDYRTLMIDHETGHRLGFTDNPTCPGTGQLAPVMMQQSMDLKGCIFNIWPLPSEFTQLDTSLGLPTNSATSD